MTATCIKVGLAQIAPCWLDRDRTIEKVIAWIADAADRDCDLAVFGEVGLSGEIRPVPNGPDRLREALKHGMRRAVAPEKNLPKGGVDGLNILPVRTLREAIDAIG